MDVPHLEHGLPHVPRVDGNAIAGMLDELFSADMTMAMVECRSCGHRSRLAETIVEMSDTSAIVLCRSCTHTLFTVLRWGDDAGSILFGGLGELTTRP